MLGSKVPVKPESYSDPERWTLQPASTQRPSIQSSYGSFPTLGGTIEFKGPNDKDYSILGSTLGSPYFASYYILPKPVLGVFLEASSVLKFQVHHATLHPKARSPKVPPLTSNRKLRFSHVSTNSVSSPSRIMSSRGGS